MVVTKDLSKLFIITLLLISILSLNSAAAAGTICLHYYYGIDCPDCAEAENNLRLLQLQYPTLEINQFEVYKNVKAAEQLEDYFQAYALPEDSRGIPAVFVGQHYFIGLNPIKQLLEKTIAGKTQLDCPSLENTTIIGVVGDKSPYQVIETLSLAVVTSAALRDAFHSSMLALFLIFLTILMSVKDNDKMFRSGALSIGAIYLAYLLRGLNLFTILQTPTVSTFFTKLVAIMAILYGLVFIKGFSRTWKIFFGALSEKTENKVEAGAEKLLQPLSIFMISFFSALLTLGESSKTLSVLRMLTTTSASRLAAFPLYLYHLFIVILPLMVLVVVLYLIRNKLEEKARKKEPYDKRKAEIWKKHFLKVLQGITSAFTFILGIILLLS